jgi:hypothetical protein
MKAVLAVTGISSRIPGALEEADQGDQHTIHLYLFTPSLPLVIFHSCLEKKVL